MSDQSENQRATHTGRAACGTVLSRTLNEMSLATQRVSTGRGDMRLIDTIALDFILTAEVPIGPGDLSARVGISTGSATELVDRLVRSGHLERGPHPRDGRRIVLRATSATRDGAHLARAPLTAAIGELTDGLTAAEIDTITTYLNRAAEIVTAHTKAAEERPRCQAPHLPSASPTTTTRRPLRRTDR